MKEVIITSALDGMRLDRMLQKYLSGATTSFLYKMLRKKNITLNGKKAAGNEKLSVGDSVRIWFSDETLEKFLDPAFSSEAKETSAGRSVGGQDQGWMAAEGYSAGNSAGGQGQERMAAEEYSAGNSAGDQDEERMAAKGYSAGNSAGHQAQGRMAAETGTRSGRETSGQVQPKSGTLPGRETSGRVQPKAGTLPGRETSGRVQPKADVKSGRREPFPGAGRQITAEGLHTAAGKFRKWIIYEDDHLVAVDKPGGILTQKSGPGDSSLNEYLIAYLLDCGQTTLPAITLCRPSVCNRLDRNTSGLVLAGKTQAGLRMLSAMFRERTAQKYYLCIAAGCVSEAQTIDGWLKKNPMTNQVVLSRTPQEDSKKIVTRIRPLSYATLHGKEDQTVTLLEVELITGRTHQIRAHLSGIGHPILGDPKYGDPSINQLLKSGYHIRSQMLHAYRIVMPSKMEGPLSELSGREWHTRIPAEFVRVIPDVGSIG